MNETLSAGPSSMAIEQAVLRACLAGSEAHHAFSILGGVTAKDFVDAAHWAIFDAARHQHENGIAPSFATVRDRLDESRGDQSDPAEAAYVEELLTQIEALAVPDRGDLEGFIALLGHKGLRRELASLGRQLSSAALDPDKEPGDVVAEYTGKLFQSRPQDDRSKLVGETLNEIGYDSLLNPPRGVPTGFAALDDKLDGLMPGDVTIIAGRPAMGKTALALGLASRFLAGGGSVYLFSMEMNAASLLRRLACAEARVPHYRIMRRLLSTAERKRLHLALDKIAKWPLRICDKGSLDIGEWQADVMRMAATNKLNLVIVDYLQLMGSKRAGRGGRTQEVTDITRTFKQVAMDLNIPVIALSQLSRAPEQRKGDSHRPILSDLRESGSIEQDASQVLFIYREEAYKPDREDLKGVAEIIISKQRNGPTGTVKLAFIGEMMMFESLAEDVGGWQGRHEDNEYSDV